RLGRNQSEMAGFRRGESIKDQTRTIQICLALLGLLLCRLKLLAQADVLSPQHQPKSGQQRRCKRWDKAPPRPAHNDAASWARFCLNRIEQTLTRALRWSGPYARERQHRQLRINFVELAPALRTFVKVPAELCSVVFRKLVQRIEHQVVCELALISHAASTFLSDISALRIRVFTVPSGSPVLAAISEWVRP